MSQIQGCTRKGWSWDKNSGVSGLFKPEGWERIDIYIHWALFSINSLSLCCPLTISFSLPPPPPRPQPRANGSRWNICDASCLPPTPSPGGARTPSGSHSGTRALRETLRALGEWRLGAAQPYTSAPPSWTGGFDQALRVTGCRSPRGVSQALLK